MQQWSEAKKEFHWKKMGKQWNLGLEIFKKNYMLDLSLEKVNLDIWKTIQYKNIKLGP